MRKRSFIIFKRNIVIYNQMECEFLHGVCQQKLCNFHKLSYKYYEILCLAICFWRNMI